MSDTKASETTEIKTKVGVWKIRVTEAGGLDIDYEADWPLGGWFEAKSDFDKDAIVLVPRRRTPSCSGGG